MIHDIISFILFSSYSDEIRKKCKNLRVREFICDLKTSLAPILNLLSSFFIQTFFMSEIQMPISSKNIWHIIFLPLVDLDMCSSDCLFIASKYFL